MNQIFLRAGIGSSCPVCMHLIFQSSQVGVSITDVPRVGDRIDAGRPLLTIRSRAKTEVAAVALLNELLVKELAGSQD